MPAGSRDPGITKLSIQNPEIGKTGPALQSLIRTYYSQKQQRPLTFRQPEKCSWKILRCPFSQRFIAYAIVLFYYSATYWVFCVFHEIYTKHSVGLLWKIRQNQTADAFQLIYFSMGLLRFIGIKPYRYENISCVYFNKTVRKMSPKIGTTLLIHRRTSGYSTSH